MKNKGSNNNINRMKITRTIKRMMAKMMMLTLRNKNKKPRMIGMKMDKKWKNTRMKLMKKVHKKIRIMPNNSKKKNMNQNTNNTKEVSMAMNTVRNSSKRNTTKHSNITHSNNMMKMKLNINKVDQKKKFLLRFNNTNRIH